MPLVRIDLSKDASAELVRTVSEAVYDAMVEVAHGESTLISIIAVSVCLSMRASSSCLGMTALSWPATMSSSRAGRIEIAKS